MLYISQIGLMRIYCRGKIEGKDKGGKGMRYAVVRDDITKKFTKFHDTFDEAKKEAERLCQQEQVPFILLEVVGNVFIKNPEPPIEWNWERTIS